MGHEKIIGAELKHDKLNQFDKSLANAPPMVCPVLDSAGQIRGRDRSL